VQGSGFRVQVQGSGFRVQCSVSSVQGSGFRVQGSGFRVQSSGFRVQSSGFRVTPERNPRGRGDNTRVAPPGETGAAHRSPPSVESFGLGFEV
jgi:hypothetical protein